jgi:hypothetical protein
MYYEAGDHKRESMRGGGMSEFTRIGRHILQNGDRGTKWRKVIASLINKEEAINLLSLLKEMEGKINAQPRRNHRG